MEKGLNYPRLSYLGLCKKGLYLLTGFVLVFTSTNISANLISQFVTQFNTDWTSVGVGGLRGTTAGSINLSGVSGGVSQAYLYWHGPTNSSDPSYNANINFSGTDISGVNIGFSDDNFWGRDNSQAYRADVTSLVTGNGDYQLTEYFSNDTNGASLLVFFDDGDVSNNRDVVLYDGNDANFYNSYDPYGWDISLDGIDYTDGSASLLFGVSDGQFGYGWLDDAVVVNGTTIAGPGQVFEGISVPTNPGSTVTNGGLWDLVSFDITPLLLPGINSLDITYGAYQDALSAVHFAVDLPAGAAPVQVVSVPEPFTVLLFGLGLIGIRWQRKRIDRSI